jgi:hypothetical protein
MNPLLPVRRPILRLLPLAAFAMLASCAPDNPDAFAPACAPVGILGEAADYSDYGGAEARADLSRLIAHGSITGVSGHCSAAANNTALHTEIRLDLAITRGPAAPGRTLSVPYFIAVTRDGRVITKQSLVATAQFPDNGDRVLVRTDPVTLDLPVSRAKPGASYRIEVGFQLTSAQLGYNRAHLTH